MIILKDMLEFSALLKFESKAVWTGFILRMKDLAHVGYHQKGATFRLVGANSAICNSYFTFTTVDKNGTLKIQNGRETSVLVKEEDGVWRIANVHFSALFD